MHGRYTWENHEESTEMEGWMIKRWKIEKKKVKNWVTYK